MTPEILTWLHEYVAGVNVEYLDRPEDKESKSGSPHDWWTPGAPDPEPDAREFG